MGWGGGVVVGEVGVGVNSTGPLTNFAAAGSGEYSAAERPRIPFERDRGPHRFSHTDILAMVVSVLSGNGYLHPLRLRRRFKIPLQVRELFNVAR
jgi:hypothetical protein